MRDQWPLIRKKVLFVEAFPEVKEAVIDLCESGWPIAELEKMTSIRYSTIRKWVEQKKLGQKSALMEMKEDSEYIDIRDKCMAYLEELKESIPPDEKKKSTERKPYWEKGDWDEVGMEVPEWLKIHM